MKHRIILISAAVVWLALVSAGLAKLALYASVPGPSPQTMRNWPAASRITRAADRDTLLMFVHPQCSCSQASMEELNRIISRCRGKMAVKVLFVRPLGMSDDWEKSSLWDSAVAIPGVDVATDPAGVEADLFEAATSGQTFLFNKDGTLLFSGGITAGRGHAGDNAGEDAIYLLVNGAASSLKTTPVFGCGLGDPARKGICRQ